MTPATRTMAQDLVNDLQQRLDLLRNNKPAADAPVNEVVVYTHSYEQLMIRIGDLQERYLQEPKA